MMSLSMIMHRSFTIAALVLIAACTKNDPGLTLPSTKTRTPDPAVPDTQTHTLSGTVYESTVSGLKQLPGVGIMLSIVAPISYTRQTVGLTDATGHYEFIRPYGAFNVLGVKDGYEQPCGVTVTSTGDDVLDVYMVSDDTVAKSGVPAALPILEPSLSGTVFETTPTGPRPIAGARLVNDLSEGDGWVPGGSSVSDASGRYVMCGGDAHYGFFLEVDAPGYQSFFTFKATGTISPFDVELKPR